MYRKSLACILFINFYKYNKNTIYLIISIYKEIDFIVHINVVIWVLRLNIHTHMNNQHYYLVNLFE